MILPKNYYVNNLCRRLSRCRPEVTDGVFSRKEENKNGKCEPPKKAAENKCPPPKVNPEAKPSCPSSKPEPAQPQKQQPSSCGCTHSGAARKSKRLPRSRNPYIIFFLSMYYSKQPGQKITNVAREAGKQWCRMTPENKEVYRKMARLEQKRRRRKSRTHRHKRGHKCRR